jgi:hypothetical protein
MNHEKQYRNRLTFAALAYMLALWISITVLNALPADSALRVPIAILPVLPILFGMFNFLGYIRQIDELQRRIQFEGLAFSVGCTGLITFTLAFLENGGFPPINIIWVLPMLIAFWGIGTYLAARRYQ